MAAYLLAEVSPGDIEGFRESGYLEAATRTAEAHGGAYLVRGGETTVLEGGWAPERLVVIRFPSMQDLRAWHNSAEYQEWVAVRRRYAPDSKLVAVEGYVPA